MGHDTHLRHGGAHWAVVPAAGLGSRFSLSASGAIAAAADRKQYAPLAGATVIECSLRPLLDEPRIRAIAVPIAADDEHWPLIERRLLEAEPRRRGKLIRALGGERRQDSVASALGALPSSAAGDDWVLVHDAARPCLSRRDLSALLDTLTGSDVEGALLAMPVTDTLRRVEQDRTSTVDRTHLWRALTPQAFRLQALRDALRAAQSDGVTVTDEAQALERLGHRVRVVGAQDLNIKVTTAADLETAERLLAPPRKAALRIGHGFDVHAMTEGDHVVLAGVRIAHSRAVLAHSDGDVILHALCDAILGALGQGDIGQHFPDSDPRFKGMDSRVFLRAVAVRMREAGYTLVNADVTLAAQAPRIGAHRAAMTANLAEDLGIEAARVNIKATTTERLGFIGREEGIAATAVVLLESR